MPKVDAFIKEEIALLSKKELEKLVIKAAGISQQFHDHLMVNYINKESGEQELFEAAKRDLDILFGKRYRGYAEEQQVAHLLAACNKRIKEFSSVCKDKSLEMDLILYVLEIPFSMSLNSFGTCFTRYNQQVYLLLKKATTLLKTKLHEDLHMEYAPKLNEYLTIMHRVSSHLDYIYTLPKSV